MLNIPIQVETASDFSDNQIRQNIGIVYFFIRNFILLKGNFLFVFLDPVQLL